MRPDMQKVSETLQMAESDEVLSNFKVAKVNCMGGDDVKPICDFFGVKNVPTILMLRPDLNQFFAMWMFAHHLKTYEGIMSFVRETYTYAYTQGPLPV